MIDAKERQAPTVHAKHHADQRPRAPSGCGRYTQGLIDCGDLVGLLLRSGHFDRQFPARDDNLDELGAFVVSLAAEHAVAVLQSYTSHHLNLACNMLDLLALLAPLQMDCPGNSGCNGHSCLAWSHDGNGSMGSNFQGHGYVYTASSSYRAPYIVQPMLAGREVLRSRRKEMKSEASEDPSNGETSAGFLLCTSTAAGATKTRTISGQRISLSSETRFDKWVTRI